MSYIAIKGFPRYYISSMGEVWSGKSKRHLSHGLAHGYHHITLCKKNKKYTKRIHVLVLEHFRGKKPNGFESRHLDGNKDNNKLSNLKWGTKKENGQDKIRHGTSKVNKGGSHGNSKLTEQDVLLIRSVYNKELNGYRRWNQYQLAKKFNIGRDVISRIVNRKAWKHI